MENTQNACQTASAWIIQVLEDSFFGVFICDAVTHDILYLNQALRTIIGAEDGDTADRKCFELMMNRGVPCPDCPLNSQSDNAYCRGDYISPNDGHRYLLQGKMIDWNGRAAQIMYVIDSVSLASQSNLEELLNGLPGGVGMFHYYYEGRLEVLYLNDGYYGLLEDTREGRRDYSGTASINAVLPEEQNLIINELRSAVEQNRIANADVRIITGKGHYKWINVRARIAQRYDDHCLIYAFYSDIDQIKSLQLTLEANHRAVELASQRGGISLWIYHMDNGTITQDFQSEGILGFPKIIHHVPENLIGTGDVYPDDEPEFLAMYRRLLDGAESSECTVRIMNHIIKKYVWEHILYTRISNGDHSQRLAIGFAMNVDMQKNNQLRYEHELQLRNELMASALTYYQLNLSKGLIEEYRSVLSDAPKIEAPVAISERIRSLLLDNIAAQDHDKVQSSLFSSALLSRYQKGENSVSVQYRRYFSGKGLRWVKGSAAIMKRPSSGDLIAFVYIQDEDEEKKNQLATDIIMDEEIEAITLLNLQSGVSRIVKARREVRATHAAGGFRFDTHVQSVASAEVVSEDREAYLEFCRMDRLIDRLRGNHVAMLVYRTRDDQGRQHRKKTRAFYLDSTHEDIIFVVQDITDLYEEEQRQKAELTEAVKAANEASHAKSDFFSRMSHDMRTPLNAILALSSEEMLKNADEKKLRRYCEQIHASGDYLLGIINNVLDMARIENKRLVLAPEPYPLDEFLNTIETIIGEQCRIKGIDFHITQIGLMEQFLMLDKVRFNQILINLLSNAVKFTPAGGRVELIIERLRREGDRLYERFSVKDTGIGMSPSFLPHAFDSFAQENRRDEGAIDQGTGLGLTIVKQIVEAMGGTISVSSELGKGTTFVVELSALIAEADVQSSDKNDGFVSLKGINALLCEDHPLNAQIVKSLLEQRECRVSWFKNGLLGLEAFQNAAENEYDLILMDIRMPVMDGLEATKAIRALPREDARQIPIIALTADAFAQDEHVCLDAGMNAHLAKPIVPALLYQTIEKLIPNRNKA